MCLSTRFVLYRWFQWVVKLSDTRQKPQHFHIGPEIKHACYLHAPELCIEEAGKTFCFISVHKYEADPNILPAIWTWNHFFVAVSGPLASLSGRRRTSYLACLYHENAGEPRKTWNDIHLQMYIIARMHAHKHTDYIKLKMFGERKVGAARDTEAWACKRRMVRRRSC